MKTRIRTKLAKNLSAKEADACRRLSFGQGGTMADELAWARDARDGSRVFLLEDEDGKLLAWAGFWLTCTSGPQAHFYTRTSCRRQGLATRLAQRIVSRADCLPTVSYHDQASAKFFASLGRQVVISEHSSRITDWR